LLQPEQCLVNILENPNIGLFYVFFSSVKFPFKVKKSCQTFFCSTLRQLKVKKEFSPDFVNYKNRADLFNTFTKVIFTTVPLKLTILK
jgi:hypothetical protein